MGMGVPGKGKFEGVTIQVEVEKPAPYQVTFHYGQAFVRYVGTPSTRLIPGSSFVQHGYLCFSFFGNFYCRVYVTALIKDHANNLRTHI